MSRGITASCAALLKPCLAGGQRFGVLMCGVAWPQAVVMSRLQGCILRGSLTYHHESGVYRLTGRGMDAVRSWSAVCDLAHVARSVLHSDKGAPCLDTWRLIRALSREILTTKEVARLFEVEQPQAKILIQNAAANNWVMAFLPPHSRPQVYTASEKARQWLRWQPPRKV